MTEGAIVADEARSSSSRGEGIDEREQQLAFSLLDSDGDGLISLQELESAFRVMRKKTRKQELEQMISVARELSSPSSGSSSAASAKSSSSSRKQKEKEHDQLSLDWSAFQAIMDTPITEQDLRRVFQMIDRDNKRHLTVVDLIQTLELLSGNSEKWSEEKLKEMMDAAGVKDQLRINFEHFAKWWS
ncbi:hypothetical protein QOT17_003618 [Balamuthia mandrillaris]